MICVKQILQVGAIINAEVYRMVIMFRVNAGIGMA